MFLTPCYVFILFPDVVKVDVFGLWPELNGLSCLFGQIKQSWELACPSHCLLMMTVQSSLAEDYNVLENYKIQLNWSPALTGAHLNITVNVSFTSALVVQTGFSTPLGSVEYRSDFHVDQINCSYWYGLFVCLLSSEENQAPQVDSTRWRQWKQWAKNSKLRNSESFFPLSTINQSCILPLNVVGNL